MRGDLPSGTVTFLFTDIEGSTRLLYDLGEERYGAALDEHRGLLRAAFASYGGVEIDTQGDAFFVAFPTAPGALAAAAEAQRGLADGRIRVRMGLHTGTPRLTTEGYIGVDVHRAARIAAAGHGGQVLVSSSTAALVGVELRDLGEHRLKDLAAPERIYQLSDEGFAPLKSLGRSNLPVPATPFVGRVRELVEAGELLGRTRLLTLTGPGGTGKTRLALQLAAEASDRHPDGVFWVPLASLADPALVLETVGRAVGAQRGPAAHIRDGSMLLLLDNYEHLMDASVDLADLLAECPNLRLLVTSRELLRLSGEQAYPVPPLAPADGTQLFLARAWAADPHFAPDGAVDELCARLDQLPLALELAAARVRVLSTSQLVDRLSQRLDLLKAGRAADPRQQTLRATIEWSHDLLDAEEQRLFARLAVFCGGCTLESAEDACAADLDVLQSLVDKSLVRERAGDRFWMLETIREFALERLEASGEAEAVRGRHAEHYIALAEAEEETVLSVAPTPALERLEQEHDNVRAALDWLEQVGRVEDALRLASAIWEFWCLHVHADEGARRFERLLALDERPTLARAKALTGVAHLLRHAVRPGLDRRTLAAAALELHRLVGDPRGIAYAEQEVALVRLVQGDAAAALPLFEENARQLWKLGDEHHALQALVFAADCCEAIGDLDRAQAIAEELLEGARAAGDGQSESSALIALSRLAAGRGRFAEGAALVGEAFRIVEARGLRMRVVPTLVRLARLLVDAGRAEVATCVLGCIEAVREESGAENSEVARSAMEPALQAVRAALGEEAFAEAWTRGLALTPQDAVALAVAEVGGAPT